MRTAFQETMAKTCSDDSDLILFLKVARDDACLRSSLKLFLSFGPRKDIAICPLLLVLKGIERSVSVFFLSSPLRLRNHWHHGCFADTLKLQTV